MFLINQIADLFDKETVTKIKIIYLLKEKKTWVSIDELTSQLEINQRTITKYLTFIEEDIDTFSSNKEVVLKSHSKKGYFLYYDFEPVLEDLVFRIIEETINYQLLTKIFFSKIPSIIQFSHKYYVSESSLWRMINKFRKNLLPIGISIERRSLELIGDEIQIRRLSFVLLQNSYTRGKWLYGSTTKMVTEKLMERLVTFFHLCLSDFDYKNLFCMIAVSIERTKQKKHLRLSKELWENIENNELFDHFFYEMREVSPKDFYDREEIGFLFLYVFTMDEVFNDTYIRKNFIAFHHEKKTQLFQSVEMFKQLWFEEQNLFLSKDDLIIVDKSLYSAHLYCQLFYNEKQPNTKSEDSYWQSSEYISFHLKSLVKDFIQLLYNKTNFNLFRERNYLLSIYPLLIETVTPLQKVEEPLQVFLVSDLSNLEEYQLIKMIENEFRGQFKLEIYTHHDSLCETSSLDLILSTRKTFLPERPLLPNIVIPREPSKLDFHTLEIKLRDIYARKNQQPTLPSLNHVPANNPKSTY